MDDFVHQIYKVSKKFPKEELFGITSQLRRASISVVLNFVEGYARLRTKVYKNFLEISYGSLQETKYLIDFSAKEKYLADDEARILLLKGNEIGAMLWGIIRKL